MNSLNIKSKKKGRFSIQPLVNSPKKKGRFTIQPIDNTPKKSRFTVENVPNNTPQKSRFTVENVNTPTRFTEQPVNISKFSTKAPKKVGRFSVQVVPETPKKSRFTVKAVNNTSTKSRFTDQPVNNVSRFSNKAPKKVGRFSVQVVPETPKKSRFTVTDVDNVNNIKNKFFSNKLLSNRLLAKKSQLKNPFEELRLEENKIFRFSNGIAFELISKIGEGGQGEIWVAMLREEFSIESQKLRKLIDRNVKFVAIKFMLLKTEREIVNFKKEIKNLTKLSKLSEENSDILGSNNFAKFHFASKQGRFYVLVNEFIIGEELSMKPAHHHMLVSKDKGMTYFLKIFEQLLYGLNFMHQNKIAHRDIKPPNILMSDEIYYTIDDPVSPIDVPLIKYVDFGLSCGQYEYNECITGDNNALVGTEGFIDPSNYTKESTDIEDVFKSDVYSLGVTFFYFVHNFHIFDVEEFFKTPPGLRYRFIRSYYPIKSYYALETNRKQYELLDFIINVMLENDSDFRFSLNKLISVFDGSYQYVNYIPSYSYIAKMNKISLEEEFDDCNCDDLVLEGDCQNHESFISLSLKCQTKCSQTSEWNSKCNKYIPSMYHCLINGIERNPSIDYRNWIKLSNKQHSESIKLAEKSYPDHFKR